MWVHVSGAANTPAAKKARRLMSGFYLSELGFKHRKFSISEKALQMWLGSKL